MEARKQGKIRFIGITNHRLEVVLEAIAGGLYDTIQYPLSALSAAADLKVIEECRKHDLGFIAMKALAGGLLTNAAAAFAFLRQYENVIPIWGIQTESELDEFLVYEKQPPILDKKMWQLIEQEPGRAERLLLPGLRLLSAMSRRDSNSNGGQDVIAPPAYAFSAVCEG